MTIFVTMAKTMLIRMTVTMTTTTTIYNVDDNDGDIDRAANNFSFLKEHISDQVSILVGQNRNVVGHFFNYYF